MLKESLEEIIKELLNRKNMKLKSYLNEDLKETYLKIARKDFEELKKTISKMENGFKKEDIIDIRSSSRTIESLAKRILDNMGNIR
jgi:uncharacterized phage infection (PIP) family protein YhgE